MPENQSHKLTSSTDHPYRVEYQLKFGFSLTLKGFQIFGKIPYASFIEDCTKEAFHLVHPSEESIANGEQ